MKKILLAIAMANCLMADAIPLGLKMGEASLKDLKNKFPIAKWGTDEKDSSKIVVAVDPKNIKMEALSKASFLFGEDKLLAVSLKFKGQAKFDDLYNNLKEKYKITSSELPLVGDKEVVFVDGGTEIFLSSHTNEFVTDTKLQYVQSSYRKKILKNIQTEEAKEEKKKQTEKSML